MAFICSICNEVPQDPVLSPASNHVFERRLIVQFIEENGTDPINGEPLSADQLMDIKADPLVKPRPPSATSIPAVLKLLQDEWDACMLHSFTLRQQLQTARQELSHALYQHDAACRVIARLTRELNSARDALANMKPQAAAYQQPNAEEGEDAPPTGDTPDDIERPTEMTDDILQTLQDTAAMLTAERKKRGKKLPEGLFSPENISNFKQTAIHPGLHSASVPGILALDLSPDGACVLTGGADKNAVVFHKDTEQVVATLKGHSKKVTDVLYHSRADVAITASPDTTVRIWNVSSSSCAQTIRTHSGPVTGVSLHPTGDYLLSCSLDEHWAFSDINTGAVLSSGRDDSSGLTCAQFHPDGLIFCTGTTDSVVKIWDLKERSNVANFPGHSGNITSVSFSENGYYLATAGEDSLVKLWDLRKLKNFKTLTVENKSNVKALTFDMSGTYLAMAGNGGIQVYMSKQWDQLASLNDHTSTVTGVRFGHNASFLASCSMDRTLRFFGL